MSRNTTVRVNSEAAEERLRRLASTVGGPRRRQLMEVLGKGLEADLQAHFLEKNKKGNKRGFPRTNFWSRIRSATAFAGATQDDATVAVSDRAFATHLFGAEITPKNARFLAIPNTAEAYGKSPRGNPIPGLFFAQNRKGTKFLATSSGDNLTVHYFLKKRVRIPKDPEALPDPGETGRNAVNRAESFLGANQ